MSGFKKCENNVFSVSTRKTVIPDPGERTSNDPCYLMSSNDVLKLIKSKVDLDPDVGKEVIDNIYVSVIIKQAIDEYGWSDVQSCGKQLLFIK